MKFTKAACFAAAAVLALSTAGQAAAAGIQIDGNGRQAGAGLDPIGRRHSKSKDTLAHSRYASSGTAGPIPAPHR